MFILQTVNLRHLFCDKNKIIDHDMCKLYGLLKWYSITFYLTAEFWFGKSSITSENKGQKKLDFTLKFQRICKIKGSSDAYCFSREVMCNFQI